MKLDNPLLRNAGTNQIGMRQYNERRILAIICEASDITKAASYPVDSIRDACDTGNWEGLSSFSLDHCDNQSLLFFS